MIDPVKWLECHNEDWREAVRQASDILMVPYRQQWEHSIPIRLECLATTRNVEILQIVNLKEGARLIPVNGGFKVLINSNLPKKSYRTAVAHEIAHTLFYSFETSIPRRLSAVTKREENFCFDVSRFVLAPWWLIEQSGVSKIRDVKRIFEILIGRFQMGKLAAARLLLSDYNIACGIAGRWGKSGKKWEPCRGQSCASGMLSNENRRNLRNIIRAWLNNGIDMCDSTRQLLQFTDNGVNNTKFIILIIKKPIDVSPIPSPSSIKL